MRGTHLVDFAEILVISVDFRLSGSRYIGYIPYTIQIRPAMRGSRERHRPLRPSKCRSARKIEKWSPDDLSSPTGMKGDRPAAKVLERMGCTSFRKPDCLLHCCHVFPLVQ